MAQAEHSQRRAGFFINLAKADSKVAYATKTILLFKRRFGFSPAETASLSKKQMAEMLLIAYHEDTVAKNERVRLEQEKKLREMRKGRR